MAKPTTKPKHVAGLFDGVKTKHNLTSEFGPSFQRCRTLQRWRVTEALRCGVLALIAKDETPHGDFLKWAGAEIAKLANVANLTPAEIGAVTRSVRNYMRLATAYLRDSALARQKIADSAFLAESVTEKNEAAFPKKCPVFADVTAWIDGRSLCEIYTAEGVLKADAPAGQHHDRKLTPEEIKQQEFAEFCDSFKLLTGKVVANHGMLAKLPPDLIFQFAEGSLPAFESLADFADIGNDARRYILDRLVGITGKLREQLGPKLLPAAKDATA